MEYGIFLHCAASYYLCCNEIHHDRKVVVYHAPPFEMGLAKFSTEMRMLSFDMIQDSNHKIYYPVGRLRLIGGVMVNCASAVSFVRKATKQK